MKYNTNKYKCNTSDKRKTLKHESFRMINELGTVVIIFSFMRKKNGDLD